MTNPELIRQMRAMMGRAFFPWNLIAASDYTASVENLPLDVYNDNGNLVIKAALPGVRDPGVAPLVEAPRERERRPRNCKLFQWIPDSEHPSRSGLSAAHHRGKGRLSASA